FFFSSRRRHTRFSRDWSSDVCSSDLKDPSDSSKGGLETGKHFSIISYRDDIIAWLQQCLDISAEQPLLRESIKQYLLLIKKITRSEERRVGKECRYR